MKPAGWLWKKLFPVLSECKRVALEKASPNFEVVALEKAFPGPHGSAEKMHACLILIFMTQHDFHDVLHVVAWHAEACLHVCCCF